MSMSRAPMSVAATRPATFGSVLGRSSPGEEVAVRSAPRAFRAGPGGSGAASQPAASSSGEGVGDGLDPAGGRGAGRSLVGVLDGVSVVGSPGALNRRPGISGSRGTGVTHLLDLGTDGAAASRRGGVGDALVLGGGGGGAGASAHHLGVPPAGFLAVRARALPGRAAGGRHDLHD